MTPHVDRSPAFAPMPADWLPLLDPLCARFVHLDRTALERFRGDIAKLAASLAQTHDLTPAEASETLQDWLLTAAPRADQAAAA